MVGGDTAQRWRALERFLALAVMFLLPIHSFVSFGFSFVTPGNALLLLTAVPAAARFRQYRYVPWLIVGFVAAAASVPFLLGYARLDHEISVTTTITSLLTLVIGALTILAILWARDVAGIQRTAIAFAAGMATQSALNPSAWSTNAWKYAFAFPITVLILAILMHNRSRWPTVVALFALAVFSALNDYRSYFGFFLIVGFVFLWRWKRVTVLSRAKLAGTLIGIAGVGVAVYWGGIWLSISGFLGYRNQVVTAAQMRTGESVLLAGRSESGAAVQLFLSRPFGFGPGVIPTTQDIGIGRAGLAAEGQDASSSYVYDYLFNEQFKLHSIASDLWVSFGLAGLALAVVATVVLILGLIRHLSSTSPPALVIFVALVGLWDLAFSPIGSNWGELLIALGLSVPLRGVLIQNSTSVTGKLGSVTFYA